MTEHEKRIREALEAGPTEGPFQVVSGGTYCWDIKTTDSYDVATTHGYVRNQVDSLPTAEFIAACSPSAIRALLADLDAVRADAQRYRLLRRGQHWSVVDGVGDILRAEELDARIDAALKGATA